MRTLLLSLVLLISGAAAQQVSTGLPFLKTAMDARLAAMGGTGTALTGDHGPFAVNPAALRFTERHLLSLGHREGFADVTFDHLGATIPGETFSYGITASTSSIGGIEVRQRPGEPEGTFSARNGALGAGLGFSIDDRIAVGVSGKLLYEKIYIDEASGYAVDAGVLYRYDDRLSFGASILNLGSMSVLRSAASELPSTLRAGTAYLIPAADELSVLASADLVKTLKDAGSHLHLGAETVYQSVFSLRLGVQTGYETRWFAGGIGVRYSVLRFDYAFLPSSGAFAAEHAFSLLFFL